mmetsp:Transcript_16945/g.32126  ORF Transcript_16945/g.32126 Transcript_16945/m.32126 type:complete len:262 (+) Transcript_16945:837-1622(+)
MGRAHTPTYLPPSDGEGLSRGAEHERALCHAVQGGDAHVVSLLVVADELVHFVGEHDRAVALADDARDRLEFRLGEDLPRGVVRRVEQKDLGVPIDHGAAERLLVERPLAVDQLHRDGHGDAPGDFDLRLVHVEERTEHHHAVSRVDEALEGGVYSLSAAVDDANLRQRLDLSSEGLCVSPRQLLDEVQVALGSGILVEILLDGRAGVVLEELRGLPAGKPLPQVYGFQTVGQRREHGPDILIAEAAYPRRIHHGLHARQH